MCSSDLRKRHLAVDTRGLPLTVLVTSAALPDRAVARDLLTRLRLLNPQLTLVWADSAYAGDLVGWADSRLGLTLNIVSRPRSQPGFVVLPRRWIVERSLSWIMRARRNCRDYERLPSHSEAFINWSAVTLMTRRLTRKQPGQPHAPGRASGLVPSRPGVTR